MEEKKYFIYAYDEMYNGLHGMYDYCFIICDYKEAEEYGREMSLGVIESYYEIYNSLLNYCDVDEEEVDEEYRQEVLEEDIAYEIYELRDDAPSFEELENMNLDPQSYIEEFCIAQ